MSTAISGKANLLRIGWHGEKYFYGEASIEGGARELLHGRENVRTEINICGEGSERMHSHLVMDLYGKDEYKSVLENYTSSKSLVEIRRWESFLFVSVMLKENAFNYFSAFIEKHFFSALEYSIDLPFDQFAADEVDRTNFVIHNRFVVPTMTQFNLGNPLIFLDDQISFFFRNPPPQNN